MYDSVCLIAHQIMTGVCHYILLLCKKKSSFNVYFSGFTVYKTRKNFDIVTTDMLIIIQTYAACFQHFIYCVYNHYYILTLQQMYFIYFYQVPVECLCSMIAAVCDTDFWEGSTHNIHS